MFRGKISAALIVATAALFCAPATWAIGAYSENFEGLDPGSATALGDAGWLVGGVVNGCPCPSSPSDYAYFAFPAPNGGPAFSAIATGEGGPDQGNNQLSVYADYNNTDHTGDTSVLQAFMFFNVGVLEPGDAGLTANFTFDVKQGNIAPPSVSDAFLIVQKTSDNSFAELARDDVATQNVGIDWTTLGLSLVIDPEWVGETLQIGFTNTTNGVGEGNPFNDTGMFYDNLNVQVIPVPAAVWLFASALGLLAGVRRKFAS